MDRATRRGELVRIHRGVYRFTAAPVVPTQRYLAAWLAVAATRPGVARSAAVSHASAAEILQLPGFVNYKGPPEVTVNGQRAHNLSGVRIHRTRYLDRMDTVTKPPFPILTGPSRTLIDLATVAPANVVADALEDVVFRLGVHPARIGRDLDRVGRMGRQGAGMLRDLLAERTAGSAAADGALERALLRLLRAHDLAPPAVHYVIEVEGRRIEVDLAWPELCVAVEANSRRWHSGVKDLQTDAERNNLLQRAGWRCLEFTWMHVHRSPRYVVESLAAVLTERGWRPRST